MSDQHQPCPCHSFLTCFLSGLQPDERQTLLGMSDRELADVGRALAAYPDIDLSFNLESSTVPAGEDVVVEVQLTRTNVPEGAAVPPVQAPR